MREEMKQKVARTMEEIRRYNKYMVKAMENDNGVLAQEIVLDIIKKELELIMGFVEELQEIRGK